MRYKLYMDSMRVWHISDEVKGFDVGNFEYESDARNYLKELEETDEAKNTTNELVKMYNER